MRGVGGRWRGGGRYICPYKVARAGVLAHTIEVVSPTHYLNTYVHETIQVICACVRACACVYECVLHDQYTSSSYTGQSLTQSFLLSHCLNLPPRQECMNTPTLGRPTMPSTRQVLLTPVLL